MKHPSIAIVTGTLNPDTAVFRRFLEAISMQSYDGKVYHYILDGGSRKEVIDMARDYHCRVMSFTNNADEGGGRLYPALQMITEDLVLILESDNIMTSPHWLRDMVRPFTHKDVFTSYSMHNSYLLSDGTLTRYFALLGSPDPTLYYLKKSDKIRMDQDIYDKGKIISDTPFFSVVRFTRDTQPVMGDNGFLIRTHVLRKVVVKDKPFYHTDAYAQLLDMGYDTAAVVKNSIIHLSRPSIITQAYRRVQVKQYFTDTLKGRRSYLVFNQASARDRRNLLKFILFSLTVIEPLWVSIRGYYTIPDSAWFLHPVMSVLMVCAYGFSEIQKKIRTLLS